MNRNKEFFKYVIPTIISFTLTGIYSIVDGFFVGNSIGDIGLSSINIAYPISALIQALGIGIGMGGSVDIPLKKLKIIMKRQRLLLVAQCSYWLLSAFCVLYFCMSFLNHF